MKQYFAINQNPDAKDLKALAQKTNLSKRVLQVWFQNARAKWRRNNLRMQGQDGNTTPHIGLHGSNDYVSCSSMNNLMTDLSLKGMSGMETHSYSNSCPGLMINHEMSASPGGSSTRPYSSPSPGIVM